MTTLLAKKHGRGLGCRFARDPRDRRYSLAERLDVLNWQTTPERTTPWALGPILDQGQTSQCTRYALAARRGARPIYTADPLKDVTEAFYIWALDHDEFPGADVNGGTSMRAMCQAGRSFGVLSNFYTASDVRTVIRYVTRFGPIVVGTEWTEQMFTADAQGFVVPNGAVAGGHAYCLVWHDRAPTTPPGELAADDVLTFQNSWGPSFGLHGLFRMRLGNFVTLLEDRGGEGYEPVELRHRAVTT